MLWCALYLPDLALQTFTRGRGDGPPLAILSDRPRQKVVAVDAAAMARGVAAGQSRASALALAPDLCLIERDPHRELATLTDIACWAGRFTPALSLAPPDTLLLEIHASLRLFGGLASLGTAIHAGLEELGFFGQLAVAPTPLAARWLARAAAGRLVETPADLPAALDPLPLAILAEGGRLGADSLDLLDGIGARRLADVRSLPRSGLARRHAQAASDLLDRAYGLVPDPQAWFVPPERYVGRLPLPAPSEQTDTLLFGLRRLLAGLAGWLEARQAGLERFALILEFEPLGSLHRGIDRESRIEIVLGALSRDMLRYQLLAREHLSRQALPAPVDALRLEADAPRPLAPPRADLFTADTGKDGDPGLLVATLRARLGADAVHSLAVHPDHRPERAWHTADPAPAGPHSAKVRSTTLPAAPRPLWLLPEPRPIACPPSENLLAGPERIESGWWDGAESEVSRDYFVARRRDHSLVWIFRERRPPHGWFLHGYFS